MAGYIPTREFDGEIGKASIGIGGPDAIEADLDKLMRMFNPESTHPDGTKGGIGSNNIQEGAVSNSSIATISELEDVLPPESKPTKYSEILSRMATLLKSINGSSDWYNVPKKNGVLKTPISQLVYMYENLAAGYSWFPYTGMAKIQFPKASSDVRTDKNTQLFLKLLIQNGSFFNELHINIYNYQWTSFHARKAGNLNFGLLRSGTDIYNRKSIYLGDTSTIWTNPCIILKECIVTSQSAVDVMEWESGWGVEFTNNFNSLSGTEVTV